MIIRFNEELSEQQIFANGNELASVMGQDKDEQGKRVYSYPKEKEIHVVTFQNPTLVTDTYKIAQLEPTLRDTVFKLLESPIRITQYNGVSLDFEQRKYLGAWGPSIDTLLFCRALDKADLSNVKTYIEVGAGSGFISKYILEKNSEIKEVHLVDLNEYAMMSCQDNIKDDRAVFFTGDGIEYLKGKKFDLIVCNPPYIPRPKSIDDNPYEGVELLNYLIQESKNILSPGGKFITNLSSLSRGDVEKVMDGSGSKMTELDEMRVPLKVMNVLNNPEWMEYLLSHGLQKELEDGYEYYQTITIVALE